MDHEHIQEKEVVGFSCALHRAGDTFCRYYTDNRMGVVFCHLPDMCGNFFDQVLSKYKKDKKRVTAPLLYCSLYFT